MVEVGTTTDSPLREFVPRCETSAGSRSGTYPSLIAIVAVAALWAT